MSKFTTEITVNCPYCAADRVVKNGKTAEGKQRYLCRQCRKRFNSTGAIDGRHYPPGQTGAAISMFYSGLSYKQIAENLEDIFNIPQPSKATIYRWVRDYTNVAQREMMHHKAHTSGDWVADEMQLKVGGQKYWNWNVMDSDTRYILASHLSKRRDGRAAETVMRKAARAAAKPPRTIKTDKLGSYVDAIERVWGGDVKHVQSEGIRAELNNNRSERLQGTFRQRTKTLRGLDSRESGQLYLDGWVLSYNLFREHEGLGGKTPAESARVSQPFGEWEDVISRSNPDQRATPQVKVVEPSVSEPVAKTERVSVEVREDTLPKIVVEIPVAASERALPRAQRGQYPVRQRKRRTAKTVPYHPFLRGKKAKRRRR